MSQKKMEAYKNAKKNKKELEKKAKKKRIISWICGIVIALLIVGGCGYLVYYTNVVLPKKQSEQSTTSENSTEDIANNIQNNIFKFPGENPVVDESRAVLIQDNTPQGASAFTAGEEAEFSTVNDGSETTAASQSEFARETSDNSGADAFSTGDFGDGTSDGDAQIPSSQDTSQTAGMADELTDNAQAEEQTFFASSIDEMPCFLSSALI